MQSGCRDYSTSRMKAKDFNSYKVARSLIGKTMCFHVSWRFEAFRVTRLFFIFLFGCLSRFVKIGRVLLENTHNYIFQLFILSTPFHL